MWKNFLNWLLARLSETSTYVAIFNFLAVIGVMINPELQTVIINLCLAIDALALFIVNEHKADTKELAELKETIIITKGEKGLERLKERLYQ